MIRQRQEQTKFAKMLWNTKKNTQELVNCAQNCHFYLYCTKNIVKTRQNNAKHTQRALIFVENLQAYRKLKPRTKPVHKLWITA